jgi:hypothetical protein
VGTPGGPDVEIGTPDDTAEPTSVNDGSSPSSFNAGVGEGPRTGDVSFEGQGQAPDTAGDGILLDGPGGSGGRHAISGRVPPSLRSYIRRYLENVVAGEHDGSQR